MRTFPFIFIPLHIFYSSFPLLYEDPHPNSPHSHPKFPHFHPDSPQFHPYSPLSHPDSWHSHHSHPDSPYSHSDSLYSRHSAHSFPRFPIPAFTHSHIYQCQKKIDGWNWCRHVTDFFQYIHAWNQGGIIISIYDISLLQFLTCKNTINLKECVAEIAFL